MCANSFPALLVGSSAAIVNLSTKSRVEIPPPRFRRIYGYNGEDHTAISEGAAAPVCFHIVSMIDFTYGSSEIDYNGSSVGGGGRTSLFFDGGPVFSARTMGSR